MGILSTIIYLFTRLYPTYLIVPKFPITLSFSALLVTFFETRRVSHIAICATHHPAVPRPRIGSPIASRCFRLIGVFFFSRFVVGVGGRGGTRSMQLPTVFFARQNSVRRRILETLEIDFFLSKSNQTLSSHGSFQFIRFSIKKPNVLFLS